MECLCGTNCNECPKYKNGCIGCNESKGCPFGKKCFIYNYIDIGGKESFNELKEMLIKEINELKIDGMPEVSNLYCLNGSFVNMEYTINGNKIKLLNDNDIYLGTQVESVFNDDDLKVCYGVVCNMNFILVCSYEEDGLNPEVIKYIKR